MQNIDIGEHICKDKFWDINITWYTSVPDFTLCFQQIVFILIPCILFSIIGIINLWKSIKRPINYLPWTNLCILKTILMVVLLIINIVELSFAIHQIAVEMNTPKMKIISSCIKLISYVIASFVMKQNKKYGIRSSTSLTLFWFCLLLCGAVRYRSSFLMEFHEISASISRSDFILNMIEYPLTICQFFCSLFNDPSSSSMNESFMEDSPFFSKVTFAWFIKYIYMSTKKLLTVEDFQPLDITLRADYLWKKFQFNWIKALFTIQKKNRDPESCTFLLAYVVTKSVLPYFICGCLFQLLYDFLVFLPPLLLSAILAFLAKEDDFAWKGYLYCMTLFLVCVISHITFTFMMYYSALFAHQVKSIFISAIYRKALKLSTTAKRDYTSGEIINLMSVDVSNLYTMALYSNLAFGAPVKLILVIILLWQYLGPSCLAGGAVMLIMLFCGIFVTSRTEKVQEKQMTTKDSRLKLMTEILNGIKILKMYAWEIPFMEKITEIRKSEVNLIRKFQLLFASTILIWHTGPLFMGFASYVTYLFVNKDHVLNATKIFVTMNLINELQHAVLEIPEIITKIAQTRVSLKRLMKFLTAEEQNQLAVGTDTVFGEAISIQNGTFTWTNNEEPFLKDIDFHVPKGSLVAVIGPVGSGKSSLFSAILGEMSKLSGSINISGSVAFVPQQAWIMNRTLRENILFVNQMQRNAYNAVLDDCCLRPDLSILPAGDKTEIGEKGVNLSGGQKQRISVGRSVIYDADIYLLDDPLSAVDAHVGKHMFKHVISNTGLLKGKTRILVTHNINVLPETDFVVTLQNGKICEIGTYNELLKQGGLFAEFIAEHSNTRTDKSNQIEFGMKDGQQTQTGKSINDPVQLSRNISVASSADGRLVEDENIEIGKVKRSIYMNYGKHMSIVILTTYVLGVIGFVSMDMSSDYWLSKWSDDSPEEMQDPAKRKFRIIVYFALILCKAALTAVAATCLALGSARAARLYHWEMLQSIMRAPMSFFDTTPLGRIVNRFSQDIDDVDMQISFQIDAYVACTIYVIGTCILIGTVRPLFIAFLIPIGAIYYIFQKYYLITSRHLKRLVSISLSPIYSHFTETIDGLSSIKAYKVEDYFEKAANEKLDTNIMCQLYYFMSNRWLEVNVGLLGDIVVLIAAVLCMSSRDYLSTGIIGLVITYSLTVTQDLTWVVYSGTELENKFVSVERIEEYSNISPEAPWSISELFPPLSWPIKGTVELKGYSTRYREGLDLVLKNINLSIDANEKVGIVGRTGAGKSSFTLALFRIIEPVEGTTLIDDIDVSQIGLHQLRSKLTIIPQDPTLFTGPLRMNLDPNNKHSDEEIWISLENAHLKDFVSSLSEGLNYEIAEKGENLSAGQRQLVCLARALLKKTKILVLDEATASVDMDTDRLIQNTIRTEFKDHTVITIAHRLHTIMDYDKVIVMDGGEISEIGVPSELLQKPESQFYSMAQDADLL